MKVFLTLYKSCKWGTTSNVEDKYEEEEGEEEWEGGRKTIMLSHFQNIQ